VRWLLNSKVNLIAIISTILVITFSISIVSSAVVSNVVISNSGSIASISPLHVVGKDIRDIMGNNITLKGFNKNTYEGDPGGYWNGVYVKTLSDWNAANVGRELDSMKSWGTGVNVIRCVQAVDNWKLNIGNHRQLIKNLLDVAASKGMYIIYTPYQVINYYNGGGQDPLPYPPYQNSGGSSVIASASDFVSYWASIATELKNYPNVIFELWNEPVGDGSTTAFNSWIATSQQCINAIRATGAQNLILFQWDYQGYINLDWPTSVSNMNWIAAANLTDSTGNLVYTTHLYYNAIQKVGGIANAFGYQLSDIDRAFQLMGYYSASQLHPFLVGEIGCDIAFTGTDLTNEYTAYTNELNTLNQHGIGYLGWWWNSVGIYALNSGYPNWTPNQAGQILQQRLFKP
jgi:hypothetical protein